MQDNNNHIVSSYCISIVHEPLGLKLGPCLGTHANSNENSIPFLISNGHPHVYQKEGRVFVILVRVWCLDKKNVLIVNACYIYLYCLLIYISWISWFGFRYVIVVVDLTENLMGELVHATMSPSYNVVSIKWPL